ncbi:MTRF1L release factor glutamine methyltransferase-like [Rhopilema esculentum]|uniref:MTRF1L release factor glutamine methyltransferase-like n=1 Tax=Rhopilema esculentum TaxID=499914 RepID=UPI0031D78984
MLSEIEAFTIAVSADYGAKSESDQLNVVIDQFFLEMFPSAKKTNRLLYVFLFHFRLKQRVKESDIGRIIFKRALHCSVLPVKIQQHWQSKLQDAGIPDPEYSIKWIAEHINRLNLEQQKSNDNSFMKIDFFDEFEKLCRRRMKREPVQYIIGDWDFRSLNLLMRPPVFIPRSETEGLIDLINETLTKDGSLDSNILEIGCGSGAISLSLVKENPKATCTAVDISKEAFALSKINSERLGLSSRCKIIHSSFDDYLNGHKTGEKFDVIVSNPPYIPTKDMQSLQPEISLYEDKRALHGGETGLDLVSKFLSAAQLLLRKGGFIWLEVDSSHPPMIRDIVKQEYGDTLRYVASHLDIYDRPRFCQLQLL